MKEMPTLRPRAVALAALLLAFATPLQSQRREYRLELGAAAAVTSFASVTDLDAGFGGALRLGFWLPLNLGIELEGLTSSAQTASGASTSVLSGTASLLYNIRIGESSSLFLKTGLGTTKYGDSCPTVSVPGSGPCGSASEFVFGGGFRAAVSPILMIRGEADYQHNSDVTSFSNLVGSLGLAVMVGSRPLIDTDRDGVFDRKDKCPDTPMGAIVTKQGCPTDTDGDTVPDGLDRCPNTPAGATVNSAGCPSDADKDSVVDGVDQCADTPAGAQVDAAGCPLDSDADGVPDGLDRCPATPAGATVDALGCPGDADNDKVPDGIDQCPNTPIGVTVNSFGCPASAALPRPSAPVGSAAAAGAVAAAAAPTQGLWVVPGTAFAPQGSTIGGAALPVLDSVASVLKADPRLAVEIVGYADDASSQTANIQLAAARADAVRNYLLSQGVSPQRLQARGAGSTGADPNGAPSQNRRTEIRIIGS
jgi:outer membrane protein OmpA-like peptidoglycan-associated protein